MTDPLNEQIPDESLRDNDERAWPKLEWKAGVTLRAYPDLSSSQAVDDFLQYMLTLEEMQEKCRPVPLYDLLGRPPYYAENDLSDDDLKQALGGLLQLMEHRGVVLEVLAPEDYTDRTIYRFITNELFLYETINQSDDWITRFVYEEFHPNNRYSIVQTGNAFIQAICENQSEALSYVLPERFLYRQPDPYRVSLQPDVANRLLELKEAWWPRIPLDGFTTNIEVAYDQQTAQATVVMLLGTKACNERVEQKGTLYLSRYDLWWFIERVEFEDWELD